MRTIGYLLVAIGIATMAGAFLYDPYTRFSETQLVDQRIRASQEALRQGLPQPSASAFPSAVYSPARAQNRQLAFAGGGALLLFGGMFAATGELRRRRRPRAPAKPPASPPAA